MGAWARGPGPNGSRVFGGISPPPRFDVLGGTVLVKIVVQAIFGSKHRRNALGFGFVCCCLDRIDDLGGVAGRRILGLSMEILSCGLGGVQPQPRIDVRAVHHRDQESKWRAIVGRGGF